MHRGQVKWFSAEKGYGFITTSASPVDVFVHFSDIQMDGYKALKPEMVVEFEMRESGRGPCAQNVKPADDEAPFEVTPPAKHRHRRLRPVTSKGSAEHAESA